MPRRPRRKANPNRAIGCATRGRPCARSARTYRQNRRVRLVATGNGLSSSRDRTTIDRNPRARVRPGRPMMSDRLRALLDDFDPTLPLTRAHTIPSEWYFDPDLADLERRTVFAGWQTVG